MIWWPFIVPRFQIHLFGNNGKSIYIRRANAWCGGAPSCWCHKFLSRISQLLTWINKVTIVGNRYLCKKNNPDKERKKLFKTWLFEVLVAELWKLHIKNHTVKLKTTWLTILIIGILMIFEKQHLRILKGQNLTISIQYYYKNYLAFVLPFIFQDDLVS